jgi:PIN domain nuclease of toxin-antitoxin system
MKYLLDTHTFIWWDSEPAKLSPQALIVCQDRRNVLLLSVVSVREMQVKLQLGKLKLTLPLKEILEAQQQTNNIEIIICHTGTCASLGELACSSQRPF